MFLLQVLSALWLAIFVLADPAPLARDSPNGVQYQASFNRGGINGFVWFVANSGLVFVVTNIQGLPISGGPYNLRVHQRPVPSSGDCRRTLGILDPYDGVFNAPTPAEFRVGDYSGKYGSITSNPSLSAFLAAYSSLNPSNPAFVGGLSVVISRRDGTRLACASITRFRDGEQMPQNVKDELNKAIASHSQEADGK